MIRFTQSSSASATAVSGGASNGSASGSARTEALPLSWATRAAAGNRAGTILAVVGSVIGIGWAVGAILITFAVIVPFTVAAWVWFLVPGIRLIARYRHGAGPVPRRRPASPL